jgi:membrane protein DedA with SNARE-associated domain
MALIGGAVEELIRNSSAGSHTAAAVICCLTLIDGTFLIGFFVNGWLAFGACLFSYGNGYITIPEMLVAGFLGVFAAELISFHFGRFHGDRLSSGAERVLATLQSRRLTRALPAIFGRLSPEVYRSAIRRAALLVEKWGLWVLVIGRWTPFAALLPFTCGLLGMPRSRFVPLSVLGCGLWIVGWAAVVFGIVNGFSFGRG